MYNFFVISDLTITLNNLYLGCGYYQIEKAFYKMTEHLLIKEKCKK